MQVKIRGTSRCTEPYPIRALHPRQVSCFLANFIIPLFDGVDMDIDRV